MLGLDHYSGSSMGNLPIGQGELVTPIQMAEAYDAIVRTLRTLADDETLLVQSGKPVGVLRTNEWAPRVLLANSNLVPDWADWDKAGGTDIDCHKVGGGVQCIAVGTPCK